VELNDNLNKKIPYHKESEVIETSTLYSTALTIRSRKVAHKMIL
jgi:hypothetical protein